MCLSQKKRLLRRPAILLIIGILFTLNLDAQSVSIDVERQPLQKVFTLLEKQTNYRFIFTSEAIAQARPVTVKASNEPFVRVLELCLRDQPLSFMMKDTRHVVIQLKQATPAPLLVAGELRGIISGENGEPLEGVTIAIQSTSMVTTSDRSGAFYFGSAPKDVTLIFTGAELEPMEKWIGTTRSVQVTMRPRIATLDETIVIGYGKTTRRQSTESVSRVRGEELTRQPVSNPILGLAGRASGLQVIQTSGVPGSAIQVRLRGRNSIANGNDPLYIIDGVPFPSTALSGNIGAGGSTASSPLDYINPASIESIEILKDASATAIYGSRGANGVILITTKKTQAGKPTINVQAYAGFGKITRPLKLLKTPDYISMRKEAFANDAIIPTISNAPDLLRWDTTRYTDWQKILIGKTMQVHDIQLNLSGGSAQTKFMIGTNYHNEESVYAGNFDAQKISGIANLTHQPDNKKWSIGFTNSFQQNMNRLPIEDLTSQIRLAPNAPAIYTEDGKLNWEGSTWSNPFSRVLQSIRSRTETWRSNLNFSYSIVRGLTVGFSGGYTAIGVHENSAKPASSQNPALSPLAEATFGNREVRTLIVEPQLAYQFGNGAHQVHLLAGGSYQQNRQSGLFQIGSGYTSDELLNSLTAAARITTTGESDIRYRYIAGFGRVNYEYAKKYLVSATLRRDGSSRYAPANRFSTFGSLGLGWVFSKEKLLQSVSWLSFGKLRLSAGRTGNDQIGDYRYLDLYSPYSYSYLGTPTFYPNQLYSPSFNWERVNKLETGIDLSLLKDRISLTVNYYHNTTTDQLVNYSLPYTTGFSGILKNLPAKIRNTGLELELSARLISHSGFQWTVDGNLTVPKNKLISFDNFESSTYANTYALGKSLYIVKGYQFIGVDPGTGLYLFTDFNEDGSISNPADWQHYIDLAPKLYGGMQHTLQSGRWKLQLHFHFTAQPYARNYRLLFSKPGSNSNQPEWIMNRWYKPGQFTDIQRFTVSASAPNQAFSNMQASSAAYSNGSFLRLRNLHLEYRLLKQRKNQPQLDVHLQGQNLLVITRYKGLDPETLTLLPPVRLLTGGFKLTF